MKNVTWNDNSCSVGSTAIHGTFLPNEITEIKARLTDAWFTGTTTYGQAYVKQGYITFKEDEAGIVFLTELTLTFPGFKRGQRGN